LCGADRAAGGALLTCKVCFESREVVLRDGRRALLRSFRQEDLPGWCEMLRACSPESIWRRFEVHSVDPLLARAGELCCCDPENEVIIVAELEGRIVGESRLCVIPGQGAAEFCVLVADPWQGLGLGGWLTQAALEVARTVEVRRVLVEVVPENVRIIGFLSKRGFRFRRGPDGHIFFGEKSL